MTLGTIAIEKRHRLIGAWGWWVARCHQKPNNVDNDGGATLRSQPLPTTLVRELLCAKRTGSGCYHGRVLLARECGVQLLGFSERTEDRG